MIHLLLELEFFIKTDQLERKNDILWRVYLVFLGIVIFSFVILGKAIYIQHAEGAYWKGISDSLHLEYRVMDADRGTIYSEDGSMLSSSIPFFDVRVDFGAQGLREKNGKRFKEKLDSISVGLAGMFRDKSSADYKRELQKGFREKERYYLLKKNISFRQYQEMKSLPLIRLGRNKSGFIFEDREKRLTPFGLLANRTIGLARSYEDGNGKMVNKNVGLELTYDGMLKGVSGRRLVRRISGGAVVPVEGSETEPENGRDLLTTLDINMQDIAQQALMRMMVQNEATSGTCIVMEVSTGKIKAMANLGRQKDGSYFEDLNHAIRRSEPGSTFKLVTLLTLLEDKFLSLESQVDLENGVWRVGNRTVYDSERHGRTLVSVKQAFELSSNVGMAKLVSAYYGRTPEKFISHIRSLGLDSSTGLGLIGESKSTIISPKSSSWNATTLPWMGFGYSISITPLHTLMLYNAVANGGKMMKPYLVNAILKDGNPVKSYEPVTLREQICDKGTLALLRESLEGVVTKGTAKSLWTPYYNLAGKTGTAQVANGSKGYTSHIYQSSFAGYFPAENPRYSCIVVIVNKPFAKKYYGGVVAGPVFREVADKIHAMDIEAQPFYNAPKQADTASFAWSGWRRDFKSVAAAFSMSNADSAGNGSWGVWTNAQDLSVVRPLSLDKGLMPEMTGMGLKDAIYLLENMKLKVLYTGTGKVRAQSVAAGTKIAQGQVVSLGLQMAR